MSENTVNGALRRLGWCGSEMTGHAFRSIASTAELALRNAIELDPKLTGAHHHLADLLDRKARLDRRASA
jgi:hypothetical protein